MSDTNAPDARKIDRKEFASGLLLILVAAAFAASALRNLSLGSAASMGPGYFPLMGWSGRAPAPPAIEAGKGRQRQGARHVREAQ
jgi:hypothetical protein